MSLRGLAGGLVVSCLMGIGPLTASAAADSPLPVNLGTVAGFAAFSGATVTSAGVSTLTGDLGVSPGVSATGFPPGILHGTQHISDGVAAAAAADLATAYADATGRSSSAPPITTDLGGQTLNPGVYAAGAALTLAAGTTLTLDAQGDPNGVFILQAGSTLTTGANSHVTLAGGAQACNVFWQVGSSATLGGSSSLDGTVLAKTAITVGSGVTITGQALARDAGLTLTADTITDSQCSGSLSNTAPPITPFTTTLTGVTHTVNTAVGPWNVNDATSTNAGYSVTVAASVPTVNGSTAAAGNGASIALTPSTATPAPGNPASTGPVASSTETLGTIPTTIENAVAGTGQGQWNFAADPGQPTPGSLALQIPGDARAGAYSTTLTYTTAPAAG